MDAVLPHHCPSTAKRPICSDHPTRFSNPDYDQFNMDALLESFLAVPDAASIDASFDRLVESRSADSDENDLIQRALRLGSVLLEAGKRSLRKRSSAHNAFVWPLPPDLTIKVFSMLDTQSVCYVAATCSFFQKCAMDPLCFANIDLATLVPKVNNAVVSKMIQRAGNALRSIKLGVLPPCPAPDYSSHPLVYSIRNSTDASGFSWNDKRSRKGKESCILTRSCLSSLSGNGGAPGSHLRRLHLYNIERVDNAALSASLSVCPSLVDLEIVGLHVDLKDTLESVSKHCPLLERLIFESSKTGRDDGLRYTTCNEIVLSCPNITTLALKGFKLHDYKAHILVKCFHKLKYVDFSSSYSFTGSFLKNVGADDGADQLEVMILRDCMHLKEVEVEQFMVALLAGDLRLLRHLDISNVDGLASEDDWADRCFSTSSIPIEQLSEQRPNFCLVAEFPHSYCEMEQIVSTDLNSDGSLFMRTPDSSYNSDHGSGSDDSRENSFVNYEESQSSDEVDFLPP